MSETTTIERAYRVRLKLTRRQVHALNRLFGAARFVWNWSLETRDTAWQDKNERLSWIDMSRRFTQLKQLPETAWLDDLPRDPFEQVLRDQEKAFRNFFAKRAKAPRFRRRGQHDSIRFTLDQRRTQVDRQAAAVKLPGLGVMKFKNTFDGMPGRLRSVTLSRDAGGRYFASFTADQVPAKAITMAVGSVVGIDMGLGNLAVLSTGEKMSAPKALAQKLVRLRRYQRSAARKRGVALRSIGLDPNKPIPKGTRIPVSSRSHRLQRRIGRLHTRIGDHRSEAQHRSSHSLTRRFSLIAMEDLNIKAMVRGMGRRAFRRSVADAGLGELRRQIEYKARWRGRSVIKVDRWYPSSKTCSACGIANKELKLGDRDWTCICGAHHDRDVNAARNILAEGLRLAAMSTPGNGGSEARGETPVRGGTLVSLTRPGSVNREPVRSGKAAGPRRGRLERRKAGT